MSWPSVPDAYPGRSSVQSDTEGRPVTTVMAVTAQAGRSREQRDGPGNTAEGSRPSNYPFTGQTATNNARTILTSVWSISTGKTAGRL